jgi:hypothetical protein
MSYIGKVPGKTINGIQSRQVYYASLGQTLFSATYDIGYVDVFVNGAKLISGDDYIATTGTSIVLSQGTNAGDVVEIIGYGNYQVANLYNRKNLVINGNFDIWQRGTSFTGTTDLYHADRWTRFSNGSPEPTLTVSRQEFTHGQSDVPNNPRYFLRCAVTTASSTTEVVQVNQKIENSRLTSGKIVTLSFWAKADATKNIAVEMRRHYGYVGSPTTETIKINVTTCALTTSWKKFIITTSYPNDADKTYSTADDHFWGPIFWLSSGSTYSDRNNSLGTQSGTFDIAQVQIEFGDKATDFETRTFGEEHQLCQRYYEKSYEVNTVPGSATTTNASVLTTLYPTTTSMWGVTTPFKVPKRSTPTMKGYHQDGTANTMLVQDSGTLFNTAPTFFWVGTTSFGVYATGISGKTAGQACALNLHWTAEAEL